MTLAEGLNIGMAIGLLVAGAIDYGVVSRRDLMMLQQNSYRNERYMRWFEQSNESTNLGRIFCCVALFFMLITRFPFWASAALAIIIVSWQCIALASTKYKKPLVMTPRAWRILCTDLFLAAVPVALCSALASLEVGARVLVGVLIVSPIFLLLANEVLRPVESRINKHYRDDAMNILREMPDLKIIGITGSYGKTSTKHYLYRILQEAFPVTMTPGSFNTPMGVIRTVREYLKPYDKVFICEMGAKNIGDIKEICDIVHPQIGIVTAVGEQHLETFKSIYNVQRTKFELVDSLPSDGFAVVNADFPKAAERKVTNVPCVRYAVNPNIKADYHASDIIYSPTGTTFSIQGPSLKEPLELHTQLVGECNISNLLAAVIVSLHLNVPTSKIAYAVSEIQQVEHRLNVKRTPGGLTIIDDAFNSNPAGSRMAMEVLGRMTSGKRIVITPGMIELGALQASANEDLGRHIARNADVAIIVGQYNRDAILAGTAEGPIKPENVHCIDTLQEATAILNTIAKPGDTVLYENDLPDTFK